MVCINFQTEKGKSTVWIPKDTILQVVRNTGTYKQEDENGEMVEKEIDFLNVTLKEKVKVPIAPNKKATREENVIYTITDLDEIDNVIRQL